MDISRASLACAVRRCNELRLANIRFAQADILALGMLPERFDLVECSGVLHHTADPLAGWRVLLGLLKPGGVMKLGLYSELGRRHISAARELVAALRDFYSASGARDLIVEFLGFEFTDRSALRAYRERFPGDPAALSFDNWASFEQEHPDTFASMYQFWIRR